MGGGEGGGRGVNYMTISKTSDRASDHSYISVEGHLEHDGRFSISHPPCSPLSHLDTFVSASKPVMELAPL
jgi:hypothetical protein